MAQASYRAILGALRSSLNSISAPPIILGVDFGDGQCCVYVKIGAQIHRLILDVSGTPYMLTALAIIEWNHPAAGCRMRTALISNGVLGYEALRSLHRIQPDELRDALNTAEFRRLLMDLMLTLAPECEGDTLYFPVPKDCPDENVRMLIDGVQAMLASDSLPPSLLHLKHARAVSAEYSRLFQDFKRSPAHWQDAAGFFGGRKITCFELMHLYIAALLRGMIRSNPELFFTLHTGAVAEPDSAALQHFLTSGLKTHPEVCYDMTDPESWQSAYGDRDPAPVIADFAPYQVKIQIAVGCPSSAEFLSGNAALYRRLFLHSCYAAGLTFDGGSERCAPLTEIVAESCAALLPHVTEDQADSPDVSKGAATVDAGASTADATLIYYGSDKTYRISCSSNRIGGARIEQNMLEILIQRAMEQLSEAERTPELECENSDSCELYLRIVKEAYYPDRTDNAPRSIAIRLSDGADFRRTLSIPFTPGELIGAALRLPYRVLADSSGGAEKCWLDYARDFRDEFINLIRIEIGHDFRPDSLALTGGTSNVAELRELFEAHDFFSRVLMEEDTSGCVAHGLALTIFPNEVKDFRDAVMEKTDISAAINDLSGELADIIANREYGMPKFIKPILRDAIDTKTHLYQSSISTRTSNAMLGNDDFMRRINVPIRSALSKCTVSALTIANKSAPERFPGRIPILHGSTSTVSTVSGTFSSIAESIVRAMDLRGLLGKVFEKVFSAILILLIIFNPIVGFITLILTALLENTDDDPLLPPRKLKKLLKEFDKTDTVRDAAKEAAQHTLSKSSLQEEIKRPLADEAVGYITFTRFDVDNLSSRR